MDKIMRRIYDIGIIPVISLDFAGNAAPLAKALCNGGLPIAEITYGTDAAHDSLIEMKKACPEMLTGAGNVRTREQADSALDAGAGFIAVSEPDPDLIRYCQSRNILVLPSVSDAAGIEAAMALGLDTLKFIPAGEPGGIEAVRALSASYKEIRFIPAGELKENDISGYYNEPCVTACSGSWMIDEKAIAAGDFGKIEALTGSTVQAMLGIRIKHIGINDENGEGAALARRFAGIFAGRVRETAKGWFGSEFAEIMSQKAVTGRHGHIGIGVNDPDRARRYYEARGYSFNENTAAYDENGKLEIVYFRDEIGGFALHIVKQ